MAATGNKRKPGRPKSIEASLKELEKLGLGTLTHPETKRWIARVVLFTHMEKMIAGDLQNLRISCLPLYSALYEFGREMLPEVPSDFPVLRIREVISPGTTEERLHYIENWPSLRQAVEHFRPAEELATAILDWADHRQMKADWFLDAVLMNLCVWRKNPLPENELRWSFPGSMLAGNHQRAGIELRRLHGWGTLDRIIPAPAVKPYNPTTQTRKEHLQMLELELEDYYAKQEDFFTAQGFRRTKRKRARTLKDRPWLHFEWFIEYQMQGWLGSEIADKYRLRGIGEDAVHSALRELAGILQVTLRPQVERTRKELKRKKLNS